LRCACRIEGEVAGFDVLGDHGLEGGGYLGGDKWLPVVICGFCAV